MSTPPRLSRQHYFDGSACTGVCFVPGSAVRRQHSSSFFPVIVPLVSLAATAAAVVYLRGSVAGGGVRSLLTRREGTP